MIDRYLVRYGKQGTVAAFGTIHAIVCEHGDQVIVQTARGLEWGTILGRASDSHKLLGELLRPANDDDRSMRAEIPGDDDELLDATNELIANTPQPDVVVDLEFLFDGQTVILYHLGPPSIYLGQIAAKLSGRLTPKRPEVAIRFEQLGSSDTDEQDDSVESLHEEEKLKRGSDRIYGQILEESHNSNERFQKNSLPLLRIHGIYQQKVSATDQPGSPFQCMVRVKLSGGKLMSTQLLGLLDLSERWGGGSVRLTSRQCLQVHGIAKSDLPDFIRGLDRIMLTSNAASGDVARNIMVCPVPPNGPAQRAVHDVADEVHRQLQPRSDSYFDVWIDGERKREPVEDRLYRDGFLPQKMKVAFGRPDDNCVDLHAQDLGMLAHIEGDQLVGFNAYLGGGLAFNNNDEQTAAILAKPIAYVPLPQVFDFARGVTEWFRDSGRRDSRRFGRMKYLVEALGIPAVRQQLSDLLDTELSPAQEGVQIMHTPTHRGWIRDGRQHHFGIPIRGGRIDDGGDPPKAMLRAILADAALTIRITARHELLVTNLSDEMAEHIERVMQSFGWRLDTDVTSIACPAQPTCALALGDSERILADFLTAVRPCLKRLQLPHAADVRIAGCGNGCSRALFAHVALFARTQSRYDLYLGGDPSGRRLAQRVAENQTLVEVINYLQQLDRSILASYFARG